VKKFIVVKFICFFSCLFIAQQVLAVEDEKKSPWESSAELGYVNVSGNTNTETLKVMFDISYEVDKWLHKAHADALSSKIETTDTTVVPSVTTEERSAAKWLVSGQSDYKFNNYDYFYGLLSYEDDRFSGFQYQAKLGLGYGRRVIHTDSHELKLEVGPGYRTFKLEPTVPPAAVVITDRQDETLMRIGAGYVWKISETSKFTEGITAEFGEDQDEWKSVTALAANINSILAMKLSYTVKRLDKVPVGTENTDREAVVTLVFRF
jgi:putative salt-induced outer membrane protein